nr:hypothetical protein [Tanacetum cinerariifolium]
AGHQFRHPWLHVLRVRLGLCARAAAGRLVARQVRLGAGLRAVVVSLVHHHRGARDDRFLIGAGGHWHAVPAAVSAGLDRGPGVSRQQPHRRRVVPVAGARPGDGDLQLVDVHVGGVTGTGHGFHRPSLRLGARLLVHGRAGNRGQPGLVQ